MPPRRRTRSPLLALLAVGALTAQLSPVEARADELPSNDLGFRPVDAVDLGVTVTTMVSSLFFQLGPPNEHALIGPSFDRSSGALLGDRDAVARPRLSSTTVPSWTAAAGGVVMLHVPLVIGFVDAAGSDWVQVREVYDLLTGGVESLGLSLFTSEALKRTTGRLRPDFLGRVAIARSVCASEPSSEACADAERTAYVDGQISFPSGHAVTTFSTAGFASLALGGRFIWGDRADAVSAPIAGLASLAMLGFAGWVGVTRVDDHHHHPSDVYAGMGIGLLWANVAYWSRFDLHGSPRAADERAYAPAIQLAPGPGDIGIAAGAPF